MILKLLLVSFVVLVSSSLGRAVNCHVEVNGVAPGSGSQALLTELNHQHQTNVNEFCQRDQDSGQICIILSLNGNLELSRLDCSGQSSGTEQYAKIVLRSCNGAVMYWKNRRWDSNVCQALRDEYWLDGIPPHEQPECFTWVYNLPDLPGLKNVAFGTKMPNGTSQCQDEPGYLIYLKEGSEGKITCCEGNGCNSAHHDDKIRFCIGPNYDFFESYPNP